MKKLKWTLVLLGTIVSTSAITKSLPMHSNVKRAKVNTCVLESLTTSGIGDVKQSILSLSKFQQLNGDGWVLLENKTKSQLGLTTEISIFDYLDSSNHSTTILPDGRGLFLRSANNGRSDGYQDPVPNRTLGSAQLDEFKSHTHNSMQSPLGMWAHGPSNNDRGANEPYLTNSSATGGDETRPKNIAVNTFIKIKRNCIDVTAMSMIQQNKTDITALQLYASRNTCDACLNLPEGNLSDLQTKASCFKDEIDLYEGDQRDWSVTCTARTVGYAKKVLMLIGPNRDTDDNQWLSHLDNQYPYYNVLSVN